jgi:hypothetical protein
MKTISWLSEHSRASEHGQSKKENLDMRKVCRNGPKGARRRRKAEKSQKLPRSFGEARWHFGPCHQTWVYLCDPEMKCQCAQWKTANSPWPKKFHQSKSRVRTMLLTFFDMREIVHYDFVPAVQSTKFMIWKYWKGKTETTWTFCQQLMNLASQQCTCSHGTVCEGVFS